MLETISIAGCAVSAKEGGGVELAAGSWQAQPKVRWYQAIRRFWRFWRFGQKREVANLTDREACAVGIALFRAVPEQLSCEMFDGLLQEHVGNLPADKCIKLGMSLLERHSEAFEARVLFDRAQRMGAEVAEA